MLVATNGKDNLIPLNKRTKAEQREICAKGGRKNGQIRREKKMLKDTMQAIMNMNVGMFSVEQIQDVIQDNVDGIDCQTAMSIALFKKAMMGDVQAYNSIRDILGQKPVEEVKDVSEQKVVVIHGIK